jgi:uncharacterized membrane protein
MLALNSAQTHFPIALTAAVLLGFATNEVPITSNGGFMPHCTKCGTVVADNVAFCPNCGAPQSAAGSGPVVATPAGAGSSGLSENVAGLLCYILGWVTGLIFYFIDKRPFVRFHAAQSMVVFGGLTVVRIALGMLAIAGTGFHLGFGLLWIVSIIGLILWIVLMIKAYQGEKYRVPIAADLADQIFGKS